MTEKQRADKRLLFRNLRCIIIDEISMVSADLLYNLDLRLREITMVDTVFGGLSVFVFGDLMPDRGEDVHNVPPFVLASNDQ